MTRLSDAILFLCLSFFIVALLFLTTLGLIGFLTASILVRILPPDLTSGLGILPWATLSGLVGLTFAFLSFFVSYSFSMRLAVYLREKRGWKIMHPRRTFLLVVLALFSPLLIITLFHLF